MDKVNVKAMGRIAAGKEEIRTVEVLTVWHDDHQLCFSARINGHYAEFWWSGEDAYADAKYANESATARGKVKEAIAEAISCGLWDE